MTVHLPWFAALYIPFRNTHTMAFLLTVDMAWYNACATADLPAYATAFTPALPMVFGQPIRMVLCMGLNIALRTAHAAATSIPAGRSTFERADQ